jgi:hypothetical protein
VRPSRWSSRSAGTSPDGATLVSGHVVGGFLAGIAIMYVTGLLAS